MGKNITVIPAGRIRNDKAKTAAKPKLKVAAYCRVSTDSDEQATSYEQTLSNRIPNGSLREYLPITA